MIKTKVQLLPAGFPKTEVLAYASKVNGQWKPQIPGPFILAVSNTPFYVIRTNDIEGKHFYLLIIQPLLKYNSLQELNSNCSSSAWLRNINEIRWRSNGFLDSSSKES